MKTKTTLALLVLLAFAGCHRANVSPGKSSGLIPAPGGLAGYQHGLERSKFSPGADVKRVQEFGFAKNVGSRGTFAVDTVNGSVLGIPNAGTLEVTKTSYGANPDAHNQFVRSYFINAGIPTEQVTGVHAATLLEATGKVGESQPSQPRITAYYSMLERATEGVPILDSIAWARVDGDGNIVAEAVYWPAISAEVLAGMRHFKELLSSPERRRAFEARLPPWAAGKGRLVIRHASATVSDPFEAFASYDVQQTSAPPAPKQAEVAGRAAFQPRATVIHHFNIDGIEKQLPQDRRNLGADFPAEKRPPAK